MRCSDPNYAKQSQPKRARVANWEARPTDCWTRKAGHKASHGVPAGMAETAGTRPTDAATEVGPQEPLSHDRKSMFERQQANNANIGGIDILLPAIADKS